MGPFIDIFMKIYRLPEITNFTNGIPWREQCTVLLCLCITKYDSTLYIGMDEAWPITPVHWKILICTFTFSDNPLLTP